MLPNCEKISSDKTKYEDNPPWLRICSDGSRYSEQRSVHSLKRKPAAFYSKNMFSGDPLMPPDIRMTRHIRHLMIERADIGDVEDARFIASEEFTASVEHDDTPNGVN